MMPALRTHILVFYHLGLLVFASSLASDGGGGPLPVHLFWESPVTSLMMSCLIGSPVQVVWLVTTKARHCA